MQEESKIDVGDTEEEAVDVDLSSEQEEPEKVEVSEDSTEELEQYSAGVQNRINNLTKRFREEERQKQRAIIREI